ncbi:MAG TPA: hypothetical protein VFU02_11500 [Polyangiaceae bacterium]|nr:hypothetical protein [Polyangiaceae bacterium]
MTQGTPDFARELRPVRAGHLVVALGVGCACVLYVTSCLLTRSYGEAFFATPLFVGFVVGLASHEHPYRNTLLGLLIALTFSVLTLLEGVICILFSLPILVPLALLGAYVGFTARRWWRQRRARQQLGASALIFAVAWQALDGATDDPATHPVHVARNAVVVDAPPAAVFQRLTEQRLAAHGSWPWFLEVGLPIPRSLEVVRPGAGGSVRIEQSTGIAEGRITQWQPGRTFEYGIDAYWVKDPPFHITRLGRGPDYGLRAERVGDWLTIERVRFELAPRPNGQTELTRTMVWRRHLAPSLYFGWLQQAVIDRGQARLLDHLRQPLGNGVSAKDTPARMAAAIPAAPP